MKKRSAKLRRDADTPEELPEDPLKALPDQPVGLPTVFARGGPANFPGTREGNVAAWTQSQEAGDRMRALELMVLEIVHVARGREVEQEAGRKRREETRAARTLELAERAEKRADQAEERAQLAETRADVAIKQAWVSVAIAIAGVVLALIAILAKK